MNIVFMINFARSGGTLLNKCLGSMSDVVMLSEINPLGGGWGENGASSYTTVKEQAKNWYEMNINSDDYSNGINELNELCIKKQKKLIVRDWSYINFVPVSQNDFSPPNELLTLQSEAFKDNFAFAFVRDAIDVWISRGTPDINEFSEQYLSYVKAIVDAKLPIFKYEEFCKNPNEVLRKICKKMKIEYDDIWQDKYLDFKTINGDVQSNDSRHARREAIKLLPRKKLEKSKIKMIENCSMLQDANLLLGYPVSYYDRDTEKNSLKKIFMIKKFSNLLLGVNKKLRNYALQKKFQKAHKKWVEIKGDQNLRLNYDLNEESIVFDLGGYKGDFANKIFNKYSCHVYIFEPVKSYYMKISKRFENNKKIKVFNFGLSDIDCTTGISLNSDGSSVFTYSELTETISLKNIVSFLNKENIITIDLMKINIEGGEFQVVPALIDSDWIKNIINLQIQFHAFIENSVVLRNNIRNQLKKTHNLTYDYWFVWENWTIKEKNDRC